MNDEIEKVAKNASAAESLAVDGHCAQEAKETIEPAAVAADEKKKKQDDLLLNGTFSLWEKWAQLWLDPQARPEGRMWVQAVDRALSATARTPHSRAQIMAALETDLPWIKNAIHRSGWVFTTKDFMSTQLKATGRLTGIAWQSSRQQLRIHAARNSVEPAWFEDLVKAGAGIGAKKDKRTQWECAKAWVEGSRENIMDGNDIPAAKAALARILELEWSTEKWIKTFVESAVENRYAQTPRTPSASPASIVAALDHFGEELADCLGANALACLRHARDSDDNAFTFKNNTWGEALRRAEAIHEAAQIKGVIAQSAPAPDRAFSALKKTKNNRL